MRAWATALRMGGLAAAIFAVNGWVNLRLMTPLNGEPEQLRALRLHLDEAAFALIFLLAAVLFVGMYIVQRHEKGYLYLVGFSCLSALQLLADWDEKAILFGPFPDWPYASLAAKSGLGLMAVLFTNHLLDTGRRPFNRFIGMMSGLLILALAAASLAPMSERLLVWGNRLFLAVIIANIAVNLQQIIARLRAGEQSSELRWIVRGFVLFIVLLLPDIGKDVLEQLVGHSLGYLPVWWEECLEDTYPWAFLELTAAFGILFLRRFMDAQKYNRLATEQLTAQNAALEREVSTRRQLDQLLTVLSRTHRRADLEYHLLQEGNNYFTPYRFGMVKLVAGSLEANAGDSLPDRLKISLLQTAAEIWNRLPVGELLLIESAVLCMAGTAEDRRCLFVARADGVAASLDERQQFALTLMAKYATLFMDYFQMLDTRLQEMERRQHEHQPWLSKLFLQMAEKERKRLASDLHDEVLQELLYMRRLLERTGREAWDERAVSEIALRLEQAEFAIRETCQELMPSFLSEQGVVPAIAKLAEKTRLRADYQLELAMPQAMPLLSEEQSIAVYRTVQELLQNASKHADASKVAIRIALAADETAGSAERQAIYINYEDNGRGLALRPDEAGAERLGIRGMKERIRMLQGDLSLDSAPGQGLRARGWIPV